MDEVASTPFILLTILIPIWKEAPFLYHEGYPRFLNIDAKK
jgi:hypothetical protein